MDKYIRMVMKKTKKFNQKLNYIKKMSEKESTEQWIYKKRYESIKGAYRWFLGDDGLIDYKKATNRKMRVELINMIDDYRTKSVNRSNASYLKYREKEKALMAENFGIDVKDADTIEDIMDMLSMQYGSDFTYRDAVTVLNVIKKDSGTKELTKDLLADYMRQLAEEDSWSVVKATYMLGLKLGR